MMPGITAITTLGTGIMTRGTGTAIMTRGTTITHITIRGIITGLMTLGMDITTITIAILVLRFTTTTGRARIGTIHSIPAEDRVWVWPAVQASAQGHHRQGLLLPAHRQAQPAGVHPHPDTPVARRPQPVQLPPPRPERPA